MRSPSATLCGFHTVLQIHSLQVFFKQRAMQFFPAWAFAGPTSLLRMPYSLLDAIIWSTVVYWLVGLAPDAGRWGVPSAGRGILKSFITLQVLLPRVP